MTSPLTAADIFIPTPPEHPARRHEWELDWARWEFERQQELEQELENTEGDR